jgi:hypothetical protein
MAPVRKLLFVAVILPFIWHLLGKRCVWFCSAFSGYSFAVKSKVFCPIKNVFNVQFGIIICNLKCSVFKI